VNRSETVLRSVLLLIDQKEAVGAALQNARKTLVPRGDFSKNPSAAAA
jgi:hypothetical protein